MHPPTYVYRFLVAFKYVSFINLCTYEVSHYVIIWFDNNGQLEVY
jgi:hypothetical protein